MPRWPSERAAYGPKPASLIDTILQIPRVPVTRLGTTWVRVVTQGSTNPHPPDVAE